MAQRNPDEPLGAPSWCEEEEARDSIKLYFKNNKRITDNCCKKISH
jgi:hypothetical protein